MTQGYLSLLLILVHYVQLAIVPISAYTQLLLGTLYWYVC